MLHHRIRCISRLAPCLHRAFSSSQAVPTTLVFDLDGTLAETAPDLHTAVNFMLHDAGHEPITHGQCRNFIGDGMLTLAERAFQATGSLPPPGEFAQRHAAFVSDYNTKCCVETHVYDGVHETLSTLRQLGYLLCVATNKPQIPADAIVDGLGLRRYFGEGGVVGGDTLDVKKPNPKHLFEAVHRVNGDPARAIMVGDGHNDVRVAKAAGVPAIMLSYGYTRVPLKELGPEIIVDHFADVVGAVQRLTGSGS